MIHIWKSKKGKKRILLKRKRRLNSEAENVKIT
jgi:hypothetical protein